VVVLEPHEFLLPPFKLPEEQAAQLEMIGFRDMSSSGLFDPAGGLYTRYQWYYLLSSLDMKEWKVEVFVEFFLSQHYTFAEASVEGRVLENKTEPRDTQVPRLDSVFKIYRGDRRIPQKFFRISSSSP